MKKTFKIPESSELYRKINALRLTDAARTEALAALEVADRLASVIYWVIGKRQRTTNWLTPNPKLKHQ